MFEFHLFVSALTLGDFQTKRKTMPEVMTSLRKWMSQERTLALGSGDIKRCLYSMIQYLVLATNATFVMLFEF